MTGLELRCLFTQVGKVAKVVYACRGPMPKRQPGRGLEQRDGERSKRRRTERTTSRSSREGQAGYVTYDELNAVLPSEEASSEQIEDTMSMLSDMGITVVESEDHEEGEAAPDGEDEADDSDVGGRAVATTTPVPSITQARIEPVERTDDPVHMYLRDMGSMELLSREGEIAIAKRIEAGREAMIAGLCESPLTFQAAR